MAVNPDDPRTPRAQIADTLRAGISDGTYRPGSRLPSVRELAEQFEASPGTVQLALDVLRQEALIFSAGNRGNFVQESAELGPGEGLPGQVAVLAGQVESLAKKVDDLTARVAAMEEGR